jgi:uncharacterized membrane protein
MDKNATQTLDPKLKEIYERVMSTQVKPAAPAATPTPQPAPTAAPNQPVQPATQPQPTVPPVMPQAAPAAAAVPQVMQANVTFSNAAAGGKQEATGKKKGLSPILIIITGVVFFVIYTLFWLKFFSIPIPFLPQ